MESNLRWRGLEWMAECPSWTPIVLIWAPTWLWVERSKRIASNVRFTSGRLTWKRVNAKAFLPPRPDPIAKSTRQEYFNEWWKKRDWEFFFSFLFIISWNFQSKSWSNLLGCHHGSFSQVIEHFFWPFQAYFVNDQVPSKRSLTTNHLLENVA